MCQMKRNSGRATETKKSCTVGCASTTGKVLATMLMANFRGYQKLLSKFQNMHAIPTASTPFRRSSRTGHSRDLQYNAFVAKENSPLRLMIHTSSTKIIHLCGSECCAYSLVAEFSRRHEKEESHYPFAV